MGGGENFTLNSSKIAHKLKVISFIYHGVNGLLRIKHDDHSTEIYKYITSLMESPPPVLTPWGCGQYDSRVHGSELMYMYLRIWHNHSANLRTLSLLDLSPYKKGNAHLTKLLSGLSYEKIWRYNNSPQYVAAILQSRFHLINFL